MARNQQRRRAAVTGARRRIRPGQRNSAVQNASLGGANSGQAFRDAQSVARGRGAARGRPGPNVNPFNSFGSAQALKQPIAHPRPSGSGLGQPTRGVRSPLNNIVSQQTSNAGIQPGSNTQLLRDAQQAGRNPNGGGSFGSIGGGTNGLSGSGFNFQGGIGGLINTQLNLNQDATNQTLTGINNANAGITNAGNALGNDALFQQARETAAGQFEGSGPEALNQASSRVNAAANANAENLRAQALSNGQLGGSGEQSNLEGNERQRFAALGQASADDAIRKFNERQQAVQGAAGLAGAQAGNQLTAALGQHIPNIRPMDLTGLGGLLAATQSGSGGVANVGGVQLGIGGTSFNQLNTQGPGGINQGFQQSQPFQGFGGNPNPLGNLDIGRATAAGRGNTPFMLNNNDPRLARLLGAQGIGGGVNAQDTPMFRDLQAGRGFAPNQFEAAQRGSQFQGQGSAGGISRFFQQGGGGSGAGFQGVRGSNAPREWMSIIQNIGGSTKKKGGGAGGAGGGKALSDQSDTSD